MNPQTQALGQYGERIAVARLIGEGLVVLERNWRCAEGEIDVVAREGDTLVVCEVKTRMEDGPVPPLEAVTPEKVARLRRLAEWWVRERNVNPDGVRVDVVTVIRPPRGPAIVDHVRGAA